MNFKGIIVTFDDVTTLICISVELNETLCQGVIRRIKNYSTEKIKVNNTRK